MFVKPISHVLAAAFLASMVSIVTYAQLNSQITGTISDPSGAIVTTANITVVNEKTGIKWEAKTNQERYLHGAAPAARVYRVQCPSRRFPDGQPLGYPVRGRANGAAGFFARNRTRRPNRSR